MEVLTRCSHCVGKIKQLQTTKLTCTVHQTYGKWSFMDLYIFSLSKRPHCSKLHISKLFKRRMFWYLQQAGCRREQDSMQVSNRHLIEKSQFILFIHVYFYLCICVLCASPNVWGDFRSCLVWDLGA